MRLRSWKALLRQEGGAAIIEMALVAPVLAMGVIGIVDMSNAYTRKLALEQAAQRAVEKIGQTTEDSSVEATLSNEVICQVNGVDANGACKTTPVTTADVTVTWSLECTDSGGTSTTQRATVSATYDGFVCGGGTVKQARYLQVTVNDKYYPIFPLHFASFTGSGSTGYYPLSATAGMRTS